MKTLRNITLAFMFTTANPVWLAAQTLPLDIHVVFDISRSNPVIADAAYNAAMGREVRQTLDRIGLKYLDNVTLHTAGDSSVLGHLNERFNKRFPLTYQGYQPESIPPFVEKRVTELTEVQPHSSTNIIWKLEEIANRLDCGSFETHLIVLSDGLENGRWDGNTYSMDDIPGKPFNGCASITYIGFGASSTEPSSSHYRTARTLFDRFSRENGFANVRFIR